MRAELTYTDDTEAVYWDQEQDIYEEWSEADAQPDTVWETTLHERPRMRIQSGWRRRIRRTIIAGMLVVLVLLGLPTFLRDTPFGRSILRLLPTSVRVAVYGPTPIAPLFSDEVQHWAWDITRWAGEHNLDPNLLATVMQIESCGHPTVASHAGAQGLFQVMPFHFTAGENPLNTEDNARRGAGFLRYCLDYMGGDPNLAMACYNGGPGGASRPPSQWARETQRYYYWGQGIYADAQSHAGHSSRLDEWLAAGGAVLCRRAASAQG